MPITPCIECGTPAYTVDALTPPLCDKCRIRDHGPAQRQPGEPVYDRVLASKAWDKFLTLGIMYGTGRIV